MVSGGDYKPTLCHSPIHSPKCCCCVQAFNCNPLLIASTRHTKILPQVVGHLTAMCPVSSMHQNVMELVVIGCLWLSLIQNILCTLVLVPIIQGRDTKKGIRVRALDVNILWWRPTSTAIITLTILINKSTDNNNKSHHSAIATQSPPCMQSCQILSTMMAPCYLLGTKTPPWYSNSSRCRA